MLPEFWAIQSRAARHIKNTGMVVTTDLVDNLNDIHPRDKADVGHWLGLCWHWTKLTEREGGQFRSGFSCGMKFDGKRLR